MIGLGSHDIYVSAGIRSLAVRKQRKNVVIHIFVINVSEKVTKGPNAKKSDSHYLMLNTRIMIM